MGSLTPFRLYAADELGKDGYPVVWHTTIKHAVREQAGHRCVRCGHPYRVGESGETIVDPSRAHITYQRFTDPPDVWRQRKINVSPCDSRCVHGGPFLVGDRIYDHREDLPAAGAGELRAVQRILTVHHLNMRKHDCRWWNLVSLCQRCHLRVQTTVVMERVYPWSHSGWFRPYVAGYYAHVYLGEDLTREQVEARLDELLALERVA